MVACLLSITHTWDDLIDKDQAVTDERINTAFLLSLIELPRNPFWRQHQAELSVVLEHGIIDWLTANLFEREQRLEVSYVLRCSIASVIVHAARLLGGAHWAIEVSKDVRAYIFDDFDEYVKEHRRK